MEGAPSEKKRWRHVAKLLAGCAILLLFLNWVAGVAMRSGSHVLQVTSGREFLVLREEGASDTLELEYDARSSRLEDLAGEADEILAAVVARPESARWENIVVVANMQRTFGLVGIGVKAGCVFIRHGQDWTRATETELDDLMKASGHQPVNIDPRDLVHK